MKRLQGIFLFLLGLNLVTSPFIAFIEGHAATKSGVGPAVTESYFENSDSTREWIKLREGVELLTTYVGATELAEVLEERLALPLGLAVGDFDEDGAPDVVSGYVAASGGILAIHRGVGPLSVVSGQRQKTTDNVLPFLPQAQVFAVPESPDFLGAGDFDGDGHADVVTAARGSEAMYLMRGDGRGNLGVAERLELPGPVTALAVGDLDENDEMDVAVGMGSELLVVRGVGQGASQFDRQSLPVTITGMALGNFIWDDDERTEIALLDEDGAVHLLRNEPVGFRYDNQIAGAHGEAPVHGRATVSGRPRLISAKVSGLPTDDLLVLDQSSGQLHVFTPDTGQLTTDNRLSVSLDVAGVPVAVLPMRLNGDERDDLVILKDGGGSFLAVALTEAQTHLNVNRSGDEFDPTAAKLSPTDSTSRLTMDDLALQQTTNLSRLSGVIANASSSFSGYPADRIKDGDLNTSWFTACGDSANQGKSPWAEVVLPTDATVNQINLRGNRQFADGYDILAGRVEVFDAQGRTLFTRNVELPGPTRDLDVPLNPTLTGVRRVRFTSTRDESCEPGFSELEVIGTTSSNAINLSELSGVTATASSEYPAYGADRIKDGKLDTSWFSACGDSANQGKSPWAEVAFPSDATVTQINIRGNRESADGYDIFAGRIDVFDAQGRTLLTRNVDLPDPTRDLDVPLSPTLTGVRRVRFTSTRDESCDPGFAELEVIGPAPQTTTATLTADYQFQNTLNSSVAGAPALTNLGNNTFATAMVDGASRPVLKFAENDGLSLAPTTGVIPGSEYSIVVLFSFNSVSGYRRIVDFRSGASENGLYVHNGNLNLYPATDSSSTPIAANAFVQVVLTRDANRSVVGYVNGVQQFAFTDTAGYAMIDNRNTLRFFRDDGGEASAGSVARIRIYNGVLSPVEVARLDRLPSGGPPPSQGADIDVTPMSLDFGTVTVGQSVERTLTIRNTGTGTLTVNSITTSNVQFGVFRLNVSFTVAPGTSVPVTVRFLPSANGSQRGAFSISSNDPDEATVNVAVSGTGAR